jgi:hypothetical protein
LPREELVLLTLIKLNPVASATNAHQVVANATLNVIAGNPLHNVSCPALKTALKTKRAIKTKVNPIK